jgi:hypothetical protein
MAERTRHPGQRGRSGRRGSHRGRVTPKPTARYTPPVPKSVKVSPKWVPVVMFAMLGIGVLFVVINYMGLLPGGASNWYLLLGLGLIAGGFIAATQYR